MIAQPETGRHKVFCIGANKTGTTSLGMFFRSINYRIGNQEEGELLLKEWSIRNFEYRRIGENCRFFPRHSFQLSIYVSSVRYGISCREIHSLGTR